MRRTVCAIIVAAGKGVRMNASTRKQYLLLGREPIMIQTVRLFGACPVIDAIFLVVPPPDTAYCEALVARAAGIQKPWRVISGGDSRQASVYEGLLALEQAGFGSGIVAVHDGVRPLVKVDQIESCIAAADKTGACILAVPAQDTLKQIEEGSATIAATIPRKNIWFAQTPQVFRYEIIRNAHERARENQISGTDDAMLVEQTGISVSVVPGSRCNIKITTPEDLALAEAVLASRTAE